MAGSKFAKNALALPALSDPIASVIISSTSRDGSAARQAASGIRSSARRTISGPVAGVDLDIAFGEIAGPEASGALSLAAHGDADFAIGRIQFLFELRFAERRGEAGAAYGHALHDDVGLSGVEGDARVAGSGKDAA